MSWHVRRSNDSLVNCSLCKAPVVYLEPLARQKIEVLIDAYPHQEWLGYLVGNIPDKESIFVEDLVIPPHKEASGCSAEAEPFCIPENCIGIIHSHHSMGAFHSGIDQSYIDRNFPVSITVAKKAGNLEYDAVCYGITPCDKPTLNKSTVLYIQPKPLFHVKAFLQEAKRNIDKSSLLDYTVKSKRIQTQKGYERALIRVLEGQFWKK